MKIRVLQGQSVCYGGIWFNQGEVLDVPHNTEFTTTRAKYDAGGKCIGQETVSQVETLEAPPAPKGKKEKQED